MFYSYINETTAYLSKIIFSDRKNAPLGCLGDVTQRNQEVAGRYTLLFSSGIFCLTLRRLQSDVMLRETWDFAFSLVSFSSS